MTGRIITLAERDAAALRHRKAAVAEAERRLAEEAPKYDGCYRLFGSVVRDEVHARSDLDMLAEFPKVTIGKAIRAAEAICLELEVPCDIVDRNMCSAEFLSFILPSSLRLG